MSLKKMTLRTVPQMDLITRSMCHLRQTRLLHPTTGSRDVVFRGGAAGSVKLVMCGLALRARRIGML